MYLTTEEAEFTHFMEVMEDKEALKKDYPSLYEKMIEGSKDKDPQGRKDFFASLEDNCHNFSEETKALCKYFFFNLVSKKQHVITAPLFLYM